MPYARRRPDDPGLLVGFDYSGRTPIDWRPGPVFGDPDRQPLCFLAAVC
ncbi:hypothetical protein ABT297_37935 [Dactylosporangium sp. NPDC000555]